MLSNKNSYHCKDLGRDKRLELAVEKMTSTLLDADTPIIPLQESHRFITDCMLALGTTRNHAEALATLLTEADYRGHYSHGMNRLDLYISEIENGVCNPNVTPEILKETPATAWVEGRNGLGAVVGNFCMELAIKKAKTIGIGWVVAKGSNHYGIAGMYSLQALKQGLLGLSMTNTCPIAAPTRARIAALGSNPISLAAPALDGDSFVLDMATSAVAFGKIEMQKRKNQSIPKGWSQDSQGKSITNAETAYYSGALYPLGGLEINSGYKGYGLAVLVEIFCGILGGASYGPKIRDYKQHTTNADLSHCFIAIDPKCFAPGFEERLSDLMNSLRKMDPINSNEPVLVAGDPEKLHMVAVDRAGGVRYVQDQLDNCLTYAQKFNIEPLRPLS